MKKNILVTMVIAGSVVLLFGCGKKSETIKVPGGSVEVTKEGEDEVSTKITTKEGTVEYSMNKKVDLESLGIPIYPGLSTEEGGSFSASGGNENQQMQMVNLVSSDPQEKVAEFYKAQLKDKKPDIMEMTAEGKKMTHIIVKEDKQVTTLVISEDEDGKTHIVFSKSSQ